jgi:hypothetical protein
MKRIGYLTVMCVAMLAFAGAAFATPAPTSAKITTRTFNDCPLSTLTPVNAYPGSISITDVMHPACVGFANLHSWGFSEDGGVTQSLFVNHSNFTACASFKLDGAGTGEGGLRFGPWWSPAVDGRFMANTGNGEIACFGGRLPFYSFTGSHGITYVKGTTIFMQMTYTANGLNAGSPATIQYRVTDGSGTYDSPVLPYDEGSLNPVEAPYGNWGCLHDATVGGYFQPRANTGASLAATWTDICFTNNDVVPTLPSSWGRIKTLYR